MFSLEHRTRICGMACLLAALAMGCPAVRAAAETISFRNDVMPVLSKAGCNAGSCHGNANGKGGFKLSLRGESPELDFLTLTRDQFGRRANPFSPEESLLLLKPTAQLAHEGGQRFNTSSEEYRILRDWIRAGLRSDPPETPRLTALEAAPAERIVVEPEEQVALRVTATFSKGSTRDVTRMAVYEPANAIVKVSPEGVVQRLAFGETTVLVRYLNEQVPVRLAFIPARAGFQWSNPKPNNFIDELAFAKLRRLRMNPSELCSDEVFVRRAYLDLLGILPTADEARAFVSNRKRDKRAQLIDALLDRPEYADFWALKWADLLRNEERLLDAKGVQAFHRWIRQSIAENKPLDVFVREIVSARGSTYLSPAGSFYRAIRTPAARAEATAQVFLGLRLQCAQCHNHPFDRWTQDDYYDWGSAFSLVRYKVLENRRRDDNDGHEFKGEQIVFSSSKADLKNPRTGKPAHPRVLGASSPFDRNTTNIATQSEDDLLAQLADWVASPQNPYFARVQANRIWFHLMGRGIVDPIDDFRATNPPSHPELLDQLSAELVRSRFDAKHLVRLIMNSRAYQLASDPNETNREDEMNYSHALVRRLTAEQLLDTQSQVTGVALEFMGYPAGMRAAQLPGALTERRRGQKKAPIDQVLEVFGKPARLLTCECERSAETTMGQAFQMISGPTLNELLSNSTNRIAQLLASGKTETEIVEELYWAALTRAPSSREKEAALAHVSRAKDRRQALEDITWSLLNAKEFVLRR